MTIVRLSESNSKAFLERFMGFEDGVLTGIRLHLPRVPMADRTVTFDIQAMDVTANKEWRLVRVTVGGVHEYQFRSSRQYSYSVLSDGLNLECTPEQCVLDLDPGPDEWSPDQVAQQGEYSKQYAIGLWCEYEVLGGPFI
ncbi:hypothetical protein [Kitasatospora sp. MAP5-34]|uniref:hypothetical protein n=1 Tax=Kitasatospora sp. MAP5-34 TaxID=3035102 RepID=UPI002476D3A6|nr:hypothetical protein [Kitasatospora sp. MAP5-34]MDH6578720.1 hypothetical protein [Kitasatospora sp. MAP5-34]